MNIQTRINQLRNIMHQHNVDACIIPSNDPHLSEYVADFWGSRAYFSGFTGSNGTLVVSHKKAGLWTDSRYFLQAENELFGNDIELFKIGEAETPTINQWIIQNEVSGSTISMQAALFNINDILIALETFQKHQIKIDTHTDIISEAWKNRPKLPQNKVFVLDTKYTGESTEKKLLKIRESLSKIKADILILNALDEIAWLFNSRGDDINFNPVFIAYAIVSDNQAHLFIEPSKITDELTLYYRSNTIEIHDYIVFDSFLASIRKKTILLDKQKTNYAIYNLVYRDNKIIFDKSPVALAKSIKNKTEIDGFRNAMIIDGIALIRFSLWLEDCLNSGIKLDELTLAKKLFEYRSQNSLFKGESFAPIVGFNENGAIVHYNPTIDSNKTICGNGLLLIDSGGQYLIGTTDITRTIAIGELSSEQRRNFTLVLKGHIALAKAKFPYGTYGFQLDTLARSPLWSEGLTYGHGTGHGVGSFLCVHEGPQGIRQDQNNTKLEAGMVLTNEPGYYKTEAYGIRIENMILVSEDEICAEKSFLHFETLTLFPIDIKAIDSTLLTKDETIWLNNYHHMVMEKLSPHLSEAEFNWLQNKCQIID